MKTIWFTATLVMGLVSGWGMAPALADGKLAKSKQCFLCHQVDKEVIGPSFKAIANVRKGTPDAEAKMAERIRKGGADHWGDKVMPSAEVLGVRISDAEARQLAQWVLSQ
jgi:cytochrome c